jgi:hypothetical protein
MKTNKRRLSTPLSKEAQIARMPLPPDILVDARQDTVHWEVGRVRPAHTSRDIKLNTQE